MNAYLSIDLDYWCAEETSHSVQRFFKRVFKLGLPIMTALHHHHLVHHINSTKKLDTVISLDYHSDLSDELGDNLILSEGTWGNFINFQERGTFIWRYPNARCLSRNRGYCHRVDNPFEKNCTDWAHTKMKQGLARIPWKDIRAIGVCLSPEWLIDNQRVVRDQIGVFNFFDWIGRWWVYNNSLGSVHSDMEDGIGIFKPRLVNSK